MDPASKAPLTLCSLPSEVILSIVRQVELDVHSALRIPRSKIPPPPQNATNLIPATTTFPYDDNYKYYAYDAPPRTTFESDPLKYEPYYVAIKKALNGFSRTCRRFRELVSPTYFNEISIVPRYQEQLERLVWMAEHGDDALQHVRTLHIIMSNENFHIVTLSISRFIRPDMYGEREVRSIASLLMKATGLRTFSCKFNYGWKKAHILEAEMKKKDIKIPAKNVYIAPGCDWVLDFCDNPRELVLEEDADSIRVFHRQGHTISGDADAYLSNPVTLEFSQVQLNPPYTESLDFLKRVHSKKASLQTFVLCDGWMHVNAMNEFVKYIPFIKHLELSNCWGGGLCSRVQTNAVYDPLRSLPNLTYLSVTHIPLMFAWNHPPHNQEIRATWATIPSLVTLELQRVWWWEIVRDENGLMDVERSTQGKVTNGVRTILDNVPLAQTPEPSSSEDWLSPLTEDE